MPVCTVPVLLQYLYVYWGTQVFSVSRYMKSISENSDFFSEAELSLLMSFSCFVFPVGKDAEVR